MTGKSDHSRPARRKRGFERASRLVSGQVRSAGETRGFAVAKLLTHWDDIVGSDLSASARPVEISYGRGFGATLVLLTTGARAPMVEMQKETIRARVNACYGYNAIQKVRITQTSAIGFAEGQAAFAAQAPHTPPGPRPIPPAAKEAAGAINDEGLRAALERLGANVLSEDKQT